MYQKEKMKTSLYSRVSQLLESFEWSDCCFKLSGRTFKAHRLLLGISSPVFKAMFYGPLSNEKEVEITDIEPDIFQILINYIYTDIVEIPSMEHAFELLYAAKKYMMEHLAEKCIDFIKLNISVDNAIAILNYSEYIQEPKLIALSLQAICEQPCYVLNENINKISIASMKKILGCDHINISESQLVKMVFKWSHTYCESLDIDPTITNKRNVLIDNGLMNLIRLSCLSLEDINDIVSCPDNVLTTNEIGNIKKRFDQDSVNSGLQCCLNEKLHKPRNRIKVRSYLCHRSSMRSAAPLTIDSLNNRVNVRIRADKTVFINSLQLPSRMSSIVTIHNQGINYYSEEFCVTFTREADASVIKSNNFMNTVEYDSNIIIELSDPCVIKKNEWYKISFTWPATLCCSYKYILGQRNVETQGKVNFLFEDMNINGSFLESIRYS